MKARKYAKITKVKAGAFEGWFLAEAVLRDDRTQNRSASYFPSVEAARIWVSKITASPIWLAA